MKDCDTIEDLPPDEEVDYRRLLVQMRGVGVSLKQLCELPPGELALMIILTKWTESHRQIRPSELGQEMRLSRPAVSRMLRSLKEKGFLESSIQADDHRYVKVSITERGKTNLNDALKQCKGILNRVISRMGSEDMKQMLGYNDRFLTYLAEELQ